MAEKMVHVYTKQEKGVCGESYRAAGAGRGRAEHKGSREKKKKETLELKVEKKRGVGQKAEGGQGGVLERRGCCGSAVQESRVRRSRRGGGWGKKVKKLGHDDTRKEREKVMKKTEGNKHSWWILRSGTVKKERILKNWNW